MKQIEMIKALLEGQTLIKDTSDGPFERVQTLCSTVSEQTGERFFWVGGWGSAYGKPEDRIIEIIKSPEGWEVQKVTINEN